MAPKNSDREIKHLAVLQNLGRRQEPPRRFDPQRPREENFIREACGNRRDQSNDQRLKYSEPAPLQRQNKQHIKARQQDAREQRQPEQQLQRHRGAKHFRQIASRDRNFAEHPENLRRPPRIMLAASLRQVAPGRDSEFRGKRLEENRHQARNQHRAEKRVPILRAAPQVRRPVSRIHVADRHEVAGPRERDHFSEKGSVGKDGNAAVGLRKRWGNPSRAKTDVRDGPCFVRMAGAGDGVGGGWG